MTPCRTKGKRSRTFRLAVAAAWTLAILALCSIPAKELPDVRIVSADKLAHFAMFALFGWLWMNSLRIEVRIRFMWVVIAGLVYAVVTEIYQGVMPIGREPDWWDAVANAAGLLSGAAVWLILRRRSRRGRKTPARGR